MANEMKLQEYLKGTCELFKDIDWMGREDKKEFLAAAKADGLEQDTVFLKAEVCADGVHYHYSCQNCGEHVEVLPKETDFVYIGSGPADDDRYTNYTSYLTCRALKMQLLNTYGNMPEGAELRIKSESGYYELVCYYNTEYPLSLAYALMLEGNLPAKWSPATIEWLKAQTTK